MNKPASRGLKAFHEEYGDAKQAQYPNEQQLAVYQDKLPATLLKLWQTQGWGSYMDGLYWTVNPADYEDVLVLWVQGTPHAQETNNHVIARTAFGDLYIWNTNKGSHFKISHPYHWIIPGTGGTEISKDELEKKSKVSFLPQMKIILNKKTNTINLYSNAP